MYFIISTFSVNFIGDLFASFMNTYVLRRDLESNRTFYSCRLHSDITKQYLFVDGSVQIHVFKGRVSIRLIASFESGTLTPSSQLEQGDLKLNSKLKFSIDYNTRSSVSSAKTLFSIPGWKEYIVSQAPISLFGICV